MMILQTSTGEKSLYKRSRIRMTLVFSSKTGKLKDNTAMMNVLKENDSQPKTLHPTDYESRIKVLTDI